MLSSTDHLMRRLMRRCLRRAAVPARPVALLLVIALAGALCGAALPARADNAPAESAEQQQARTILMGMCDYLSGQEKFTVAMRGGYDVVQASGQKIEFRQVAKASIARPKQMLFTSESSSGLQQRIVIDGSMITVADDGNKLYSQAAREGSLDDTIKFFVQDLKMRLPLAPLFMQQLPAEMKRRALQVDYVEPDKTLGVPTHHLAVRMETVDMQVWITEGDHPVPMRIILTYKEEPGGPQFWADFSDWNFTPQYDPATFTFVAAKDARKIPFVSKISAAGTEGAGQ